jgi:hypothetical protein
MSKEKIFVGNQNLKLKSAPVQGDFVEIDGETFYKISNYDLMNPFLISIVSASDHWMYISSKGGLTSGRLNPDNALFPYITDDQLHDINEITGSKTIIKVFVNKKIYLWEPFSERFEGIYSTERNLYKNISSSKIIYEEINNDLGLIFKYGWTTSNKYGFVKFSEVINSTDQEKEIEILDGIQNILPSGINQKIQTEYSTLVDGYKKNELIENIGLGIFSLSSIPSDLAQPSESLTATTVCSTGLDVNKFLLSSQQIDGFRKNLTLEPETSSKGIRGAYFINSHLKIKSGHSKDWYIIAEVNQNAGNIFELKKSLRNKKFKSILSDDIKHGQISLKKMVAQADGLQLTEDKLASARHFSNVLFNIMRGGVFNESYFIDKKDFIAFVKKANPFVLKAHADFLNNLPEKILQSELFNQVNNLGDAHFSRIALEYLPLTFSRRHGDPSRPWNKFSIEVRNEKNEKVLNYQGNWRDIFQNWEALALSYPKFLESMISKFLNASTADGYNPYRIFRDGFDWEIQEPDNPWANIGYWGDHQIVYLLKLLELAREFNPSSLKKFLVSDIFTYANVPYRIKEYQEILKDPRNTIQFDHQLDNRLKSEEKLYGSDTKFLKKADISLVQVNLIEKLLLTLLMKLSNFVPDGGIWMNTQRPEWNDANNALAGYGISMVTLYYLRRYLEFLEDFLSESEIVEFKISEEVEILFKNIYSTMAELCNKVDDDLSDKERKDIVDQLGLAASKYRNKIYAHGFSNIRKDISKQNIIEFIDLCRSIVDDTIKKNKRKDDLYHSYNLLHISNNEMKITNLYEMLEGQVAVLSSGYLKTEESIELLNSLKRSRLYREDQNSYLLYPNIELPLFINKNNITPEFVERSELLKLMLKNNRNDIVYKDIDGVYHFQNDIINSQILNNKLKKLEAESEYKEYIKNDSELISDIYETIFCHKKFTGRATTFFKYEGLGSIYWHMVSKLLLATQEVYSKAESNDDEKEKLQKLKEIYYDIREGIAAETSPDKYGAFPTDPYSHTPSFAGVQQPGMTGKVKEDIISRMHEIGIAIKSGKIIINPSLLKVEEFTKNAHVFIYYDLSGIEQKIKCSKKSIAFTLCQVPFIFKLSVSSKIIVHFENDDQISINGLDLGEDLSQSIFNRENKVKQVEVFLEKKIFEQ